MSRHEQASDLRLEPGRPRGFLFDLDGTLIDTAPDIDAALNAALSAGGYGPVSEDLTRHWVGFGSRILLIQALTYLGAEPRSRDESHLAVLLKVFIDHYRAHIADTSRPYPGVVKTLTQLRNRGCALAVVTNKLEALTHPLLDTLELSQYFDAIVGGDTCKNGKPAADPALFALKLMNVSVQQSLFVGDSETDVLCARAAGCAVVCVRDGYNHGTNPNELGADRVIEDFTELLEYSLMKANI